MILHQFIRNAQRLNIVRPVMRRAGYHHRVIASSNIINDDGTKLLSATYSTVSPPSALQRESTPPPALFKTPAGSLSFTSSAAPAAKDDNDKPVLTLYQYAICPFCNKVKALLDYAKQDYDIVEVNPLSKAELKQFDESYRKVPIMTMGSSPSTTNTNNEDNDIQQFNGSDDIMLQGLLEQESFITKIEKEHPTTKFNVNEFTSSEEAKKWIQFANDDLAPLLYPNLCNTLSNSYQAFNYIQDIDKFTSMQKMSIRIIGSFAMYMAASKVKSKF